MKPVHIQKSIHIPQSLFGKATSFRSDFRTGYKHSLRPSFFSSVRQFATQNLIRLPVLDAMVNKTLANSTISPLSKTAIVYVHHPLQTSVNLIDAMIRLGAKQENIFVLGKHYSECLAVVNQVENLGVHYQPCSAQIGLGKFSHSFARDINRLWSMVETNIQKDKNVENVIILDHGGHALDFIPPAIIEEYKVVGVEKTTGGLINLDEQGLPPFPVIGLANCAAKRIFESPLIAEAVVTKLLPLIPIKDANLTCGVVGYGAIGKAVTAKLKAMGHKVIVYDSDPNQLKNLKDVKGVVQTNELAALLVFADYIFGCTGRDITTSIDYFRVCTKDKTLISCSSEDKEFLTLLQTVQQKKNGKVAAKPLNQVVYNTDMGASIRILKGGFPVNFDSSGESVPANDIQLTRALVLASILQAVQFFKQPDLLDMGGLYTLDASAQKFVVNEWLKYQPLDRFSKDVIEKFQDPSWIVENSGGIYKPCNIFANAIVEHSDQNSIESRLEDASFQI